MTEQTASKVPQVRFKGFEGDWEEKTFEQNITSIQTGTNLLGSVTGKGTPLLKMGNIQRGYFSLDRLEALDARAKVEAENIAYYGDFLFNTRNTLDLVGKGATWMGESGKFAFNSNLARFKFRGIDTIFFNYLYNTQSLVFQVKARAMGTTSVAAIYPQSLNSLEYKLPTSAEQTKIGGYFRELDSLIGLHQRKHDKLVTLKKAMLQKMFPQPGGATPEIRFKGFSGAWMENEFKLIASRSTQSTSEEHLPRIEYEDIISGTGRLNKDIFKKSSRKVGIKFEKGDVLFGKLRPYLRNWWLAEFDGIAVGDFWVLKSATATSDLIYCLIQTEAFERIANQSAGSKMPRSDWKLVSNSVFRIPLHIEEQQKIGTYFRTLDELISQHATQLQKLQQIKSACLEKMFV